MVDIQLQNTFYFVRHGQAKHNELGIDSYDFEIQKQHGLTEQGRRDVEKEAKRYTDFDYIYSSPFRRTKETAEYFAQTSSCKIILDDRLKEWDHKESLHDVQSRIIDFIQEVDSQHKNKKILIVSHGIPCEVITDWSNGIQPNKWEKCIKKANVFSLKN